MTQRIKNTSGSKKADALNEVKVLDFTAVIAGTYCTRLMADLGAIVLKIEPPSGEIMRSIAPMRKNVSTVFSSLNAGKKCMVLDLKKPEAIEICYRLIKSYDVVVENFSPGVMDKLGLSYETLRKINPNIIMCSISGYGQQGPGADRPAYAPIVQALTGFDSVTLAAQNNTSKPLNMGLPVGDTTAAIQAFGAIMVALYYRERKNVGQYIDIAMADSLLSTMNRDFQTAFHSDPIDRRYGPLKTNDGYIVVMPLSQRHFKNLIECIQMPQLINDKRFSSDRARLDNYNQLLDFAEQWASNRSTEKVLAAFEKARVPCAPYNSLSDVVNDAQLIYRNMLTEVIDESGPLTVVNSPFIFSETQAEIRKEVATLGQHSRNILSEELQVPQKDINVLVEKGIING
jgi:crotonobetainyl-CoA:carnitine CoA-transferase CaiB-like acyl-CoA transferase